jgi:predicted amino acid-binding ACT domain protein
MTGKPFRFVIQFAGEDIPGLLHAWTKSLATLNYNISDINLATGGPVHTTFLTCQVEEKQVEESKNNLNRNPWRDRLEIETTLQEAVRKRYSEFNKDHNLSDPKPEDEQRVVVTLDEPEHRVPSFHVYLKIKFKDRPGALANLTDMLKSAFTINNAFSHPVLDEVGKQAAPPEERMRFLYTRLECFIRKEDEKELKSQREEKQGKKNGKALSPAVASGGGPTQADAWFTRPATAIETPGPLGATSKTAENENRRLADELRAAAWELHLTLKEREEVFEGSKPRKEVTKKAQAVADKLKQAKNQWTNQVGDFVDKQFSVYDAEVQYGSIVWKDVVVHECEGIRKSSDGLSADAKPK